MKLAPAKLGGSKKQITLLGVLVAAMVLSYWLNHTSDSPAAASTPSTPAPSATPSFGTPPPSRTAPSVPIQRSLAGTGREGISRGTRTTEDFKPSLKPKEGIDVTSIDPTLNLGMLAKLRDLPMEGGARSVFKEGAPPPPPPPPDVKIVPLPLQTADGKSKSTEPAKPPGPPPAPPPPPIPLKFYGYANQQRGGPKQAFFLDGDDIRIAGENDIIRNRYKIVKIGVNSAVVEDTTDKHQQTLPLEPELV